MNKIKGLFCSSGLSLYHVRNLLPKPKLAPTSCETVPKKRGREGKISGLGFRVGHKALEPPKAMGYPLFGGEALGRPCDSGS